MQHFEQSHWATHTRIQMDGKEVIGDFLTSFGISAEYTLQCRAHKCNARLVSALCRRRLQRRWPPIKWGLHTRADICHTRHTQWTFFLKCGGHLELLEVLKCWSAGVLECLCACLLLHQAGNCRFCRSRELWSPDKVERGGLRISFLWFNLFFNPSRHHHHHHLWLKTKSCQQSSFG